jgi:hypothetical protein
MKIFISILCLLSISCSCDITDLFEGKCYQNGLIKTIEQSTEIVVTEHSYESDFFYVGLEKLKHQEITYHKLTLTEGQKGKFIASIKALPDEEKPHGNILDAVTGCSFEPHHTIKFYKGEKLLSTMDICFVCSQVEWDGSIQTPPKSIYKALYDFITLIDLKPDQDWSALVRKFLAEKGASMHRTTVNSMNDEFVTQTILIDGINGA